MRRSLALLCLAALVACTDGEPAARATTTTASTTTTAPAASTTTASTTPTTAPEPSALALRGDGLGVVALGASPDAAVAAVTAELGEPSADTGWESPSTYGVPGEQIRGVEWGALVLLFTDRDTDVGRGEHLFTWRVSGAPPAVGTANGLGFGATDADADELYPGKVERVPAEDPFPAFLRIAAEGGTITAYLDDADQITNLEAGVPCSE